MQVFKGVPVVSLYELQLAKNALEETQINLCMRSFITTYAFVLNDSVSLQRRSLSNPGDA